MLYMGTTVGYLRTKYRPLRCWLLRLCVASTCGYRAFDSFEKSGHLSPRPPLGLNRGGLSGSGNRCGQPRLHGDQTLSMASFCPPSLLVPVASRWRAGSCPPGRRGLSHAKDPEGTCVDAELETERVSCDKALCRSSVARPLWRRKLPCLYCFLFTLLYLF